jgi:hypothetical protein
MDTPGLSLLAGSCPGAVNPVLDVIIGSLELIAYGGEREDHCHQQDDDAHCPLYEVPRLILQKLLEFGRHCPYTSFWLISEYL